MDEIIEKVEPQVKKLFEIKSGEEFYVVCAEPFIATAELVETGFNDSKELVVKITAGATKLPIEIPADKDVWEVKPGFIMMADKTLFQKTIRPLVEEKCGAALAVLKYYNTLMKPAK